MTFLLLLFYQALVTVNLTSLLVLTTLFISVSGKVLGFSGIIPCFEIHNLVLILLYLIYFKNSTGFSCK